MFTPWQTLLSVTKYIHVILQLYCIYLGAFRDVALQRLFPNNNETI